MKKQFLITNLLIIVILITVSCIERDAARDVSGFYKRVSCETPTSPPRAGLEIKKMEGNNFYASIVFTDGTKIKQKMIFGLYGKEMKFHSVPLVTFKDDNFTTLYHQPSLCTYKK